MFYSSQFFSYSFWLVEHHNNSISIALKDYLCLFKVIVEKKKELYFFLLLNTYSLFICIRRFSLKLEHPSLSRLSVHVLWAAINVQRWCFTLAKKVKKGFGKRREYPSFIPYKKNIYKHYMYVIWRWWWRWWCVMHFLKNRIIMIIFM